MELIWLECFTKKFVLIELFTPKITRAQEVEWQAACRLFSTKLQCSFCANFLQCERQHLIFIQQGLWSLPVVFFSSFKKKKKKSRLQDLSSKYFMERQLAVRGSSIWKSWMLGQEDQSSNVLFPPIPFWSNGGIGTMTGICNYHVCKLPWQMLIPSPSNFCGDVWCVLEIKLIHPLYAKCCYASTASEGCLLQRPGS